MLLAARNRVYGLALSKLITGSLARRLVAAQLVLDESTAMATAQEHPRAQRAAFWLTGGSIFVCWNLGTLVGALAGEAIDPLTFGLDAAFPAGFVAMVAPHLRHRLGLEAGILGGADLPRADPVHPGRRADPVLHGGRPRSASRPARR